MTKQQLKTLLKKGGVTQKVFLETFGYHSRNLARYGANENVPKVVEKIALFVDRVGFDKLEEGLNNGN